MLKAYYFLNFHIFIWSLFNKVTKIKKRRAQRKPQCEIEFVFFFFLGSFNRTGETGTRHLEYKIPINCGSTHASHRRVEKALSRDNDTVGSGAKHPVDLPRWGKSEFRSMSRTTAYYTVSRTQRGAAVGRDIDRTKQNCGDAVFASSVGGSCEGFLRCRNSRKPCRCRTSYNQARTGLPRQCVWEMFFRECVEKQKSH